MTDALLPDVLPLGEPDLRPLVELACTQDEVQCPSCGWIGRWSVVEDDAPTVVGTSCVACGQRWDPAQGRPARVVVDAVLAEVGMAGGTAAGGSTTGTTATAGSTG